VTEQTVGTAVEEQRKFSNGLLSVTRLHGSYSLVLFTECGPSVRDDSRISIIRKLGVSDQTVGRAREEHRELSKKRLSDTRL
jgi:hypothetical protein